MQEATQQPIQMSDSHLEADFGFQISAAYS